MRTSVCEKREDQAHPEKFLLHMYIGATVFAIYIYIYIYIYIATICLLNSACRQGVCLCGQSRYLIHIYVSDIYIYFHYSSTQLRLPTGSVIVWTKLSVQCMHMHLWMDIVATVYTYCCYLIYIYVSAAGIHIYVVTIREYLYKWS